MSPRRKRHAGGRPKRADPRRVKMGFKASEAERKRIAAIAKSNGQTVADFIREAVIEAASDCTDEPVFRASV